MTRRTHDPAAARSRAPRRRSAALFAAACALVQLAGCGGLLPRPAALPAQFTLDGGSTMADARVHTSGAPSLVVAVPRAAPGYDSRRMLYLRRPHELEAFAFHEWVDAPAQMLAPLLVRALQDSAGFRVVLLAPSAAAGAWRLETELVRLHQDFGTRPSQVRLGLRAVLLDTATRQVIAWREFDASIAAAADDPVAGVRAAHEATQRVLADVAAFCAEQARSATSGRP